MAEMARSGDAPRQLLYSPPYQLAQQNNVEGDLQRMDEIHRGSLLIDNLGERMTENFEDKWIDVGFWVQPDGRVDDVQLLRRRSPGSWEGPLLESIRGRRYSPGERPTYRRERYTFTSTLHNTATGTHIADRSPRGRIEYLDLTAAPQAPTQSSN
jgi:hypothetical protein